MKKAWLPYCWPSSVHACACERIAIAARGGMFPDCDGAGIVRLAANVLSRHDHTKADLERSQPDRPEHHANPIRRQWVRYSVGAGFLPPATMDRPCGGRLAYRQPRL